MQNATYNTQMQNQMQRHRLDECLHGAIPENRGSRGH